MSKPMKPVDDEDYGPVYRPKGSGKGGLVQEGDDIPEDGKGATRATLGDYLSNLTKKNQYKVEPGSNPAPSHRDVGGSPKLFTAFKDGGSPTGAGAETTFLDDALDNAKGVEGALRADDFVLTGRSTYKNPKVNAGILSMEDAGDGRVYDMGVGSTRGKGHTLFSGIQKVVGLIEWLPGKAYDEGEIGSHDIQKRVSKILQNNRFHPTKGSPYILEGEFSQGKQGSLGSVQNTLGSYDPASTPLSTRDLMDIGRKIMVAGTGHAASEIEGLASLIPNFQQLGIPFMNVPTANLDASAVLKEISGQGWSQGERSSMLNPAGASNKGINAGEQGTDQTLRGALSNPGDSYGHLNSYYEPFSGALPFGMIMVGLGGLLSLMVQAAVIIGIIELINIMPSADPLRRNPNNPLTLPKGRKQGLRSYNAIVGPVMEWLGVPELESNAGLFPCVFRGIGTFYNVPNFTGLPSPMELLEMVNALVEQGGYNASVIRSATRDLEQVVNVALPMMRGDTMSIIGGVIEVIKNLGNSNAVKFLMICVRLGDLLQVGDTWQFSSLRSHPDLLKRTGSTRLAKSRTSTKDPTLVWSHSALPSAFLLPKQLAVAGATFGLQKGMGHSALQTRAMYEEDRIAGKKDVDPVTGRITKAYVKEIEDKLEYEYVPFYFQDLRTNEIVAFHAFLSGIKDDYSPSYNTMGGYGRMDKVQIYESTERSISFSFHVIATNPEDFDSMWYSINKLVTMVYPQWSGGTVMKSQDDKKFVMPFSQIPAASPMIRLRIGDLIKTNYTRFNLSRIFGTGHGDKADGAFHIAGADKNPDFDDFDPKSETMVKYLADLRTPPSDPSDTEFGWQDNMTAMCKPGEFSIKDPKDDTPITIKIQTQCRVKVTSKEWPGMMFIPFLTAPLSHPPPYICELVDDGDKEFAEDMAGVKFYVAHASLIPDPKQTDTDQADLNKSLPDAVEENDVSKWFSPESNAIVRSFESTAGRGLAGFITSLSFNHDDATWETRKLGSRAPMWMTVDVGFSPVHDLPPGLDDTGFNRAPLYNVGGIMNNLSGPDIHETNLLDPADKTVEGWSKDRSQLLPSVPKDKDAKGSEGNE